MALQLVVVVADHRKRRSALDHLASDAKYIRRPRPSIDKVADENRPAPFWRGNLHLLAGPFQLVAKLRQQCLKLVSTAVNVPDDVERARIFASVSPQLGACNHYGIDLF